MESVNQTKTNGDVQRVNNRMQGLNVSEVDDEGKKTNLSAEAVEFVPRWLKTDASAKPEVAGSASDFGDLPEASIEAYETIAGRMVKSPILADECVPGLIDLLQKEISAEARKQALGGVCTIVLDKASSEYNSRHAMSRMANVLLQTFESSNKELAAEFWNALHSQLLREHEKSSETLASNPNRYKNFASFLAEVLGTSSRMFGHQKADELSDLVILVLEDFFRTDDGDQWKTAGQVLKQVGAYLEDNFAARKDSSGASKMDLFMFDVDARGNSGRDDIPFYIRSMLINIIELRRYNWGRSTVPVTAGGSDAQQSRIHVSPPHQSRFGSRHVHEPLSHRHAGMMSLNSEERAFMERESGYLMPGEDDDDGDMDDEMERAYDQFLQMNSRRK